MPSYKLFMTPVQEIAITCLKNRAKYDLQANTTLRNIKRECDWLYPEIERIKVN